MIVTLVLLALTFTFVSAWMAYVAWDDHADEAVFFLVFSAVVFCAGYFWRDAARLMGWI